MTEQNITIDSETGLLNSPGVEWFQALLTCGENPTAVRQLLEKAQGEIPSFLPGRSLLPLSNDPGRSEVGDLDWLCRLFSWAELNASPDMTKIIADTIITFQLHNTIIAPKDSLPLPWGSVSYLSAAAAYNALCIINPSLGDADADKKSTQDLLDLWLIMTAGLMKRMWHIREGGKSLLDKYVFPEDGILKKVSPDHILETIRTLQIKSGDYISIHTFHKGFAKCLEILTAEWEELTEQEKEAEKARERAKPGIIARFFIRLLRLLSINWGRGDSRGPSSPITRLEITISRLQRILDAWKNIDPLAKVLDKKPGEQDVKSIARLFAEPDAEGFQYWLMNKIVPLCFLFANGSAVPVPGGNSPFSNAALFLPLEILEVAKSPGIPGDFQQSWMAYLSLLRFYGYWLETIPPLQDIEKRMAFVTTSQKNSCSLPFKPFFEPWDELKRVCEELILSISLYREGHIQLAILREYAELHKEWDKPAEYWRGREVKTWAQKFQCLHDYFLNVRGMMDIDESYIQGGEE